MFWLDTTDIRSSYQYLHKVYLHMALSHANLTKKPGPARSAKATPVTSRLISEIVGP